VTHPLSLLLVMCSFAAMQLISLETPIGGNAGSTMDAMSDAIEGADVMLYGVSLAYKESANVSWQLPLLTSTVLFADKSAVLPLPWSVCVIAPLSADWRPTMGK
jgi:hypothetical protein